MIDPQQVASDAVTGIGKDLALSLYETMLKIRLFESTEMDVFARGEQEGFVHMYIGEEAIAAGACQNLNKDDYITSTHRGHGHLIAKGGDMGRMMGELYGRTTGYCKGKSGSLHIADFSLGILGANGIVAGGIPIAVGAGYSIKLRGTKQVSVAFFGDGASAQGAFHEAMNLAATVQLPVVFVMENNEWVCGTDMRLVTPAAILSDLSCRAAAYGMEGYSVDGNDVVEVFRAVGRAVEKARNGGGPTLINCRTYRIRCHFEGDLDTRDKDEVEAWRKRDPIERMEKRLLAAGFVTAEDIAARRAFVQHMVNEAVDFGRSSPVPPAEEALTDVFAE